VSVLRSQERVQLPVPAGGGDGPRQDGWVGRRRT
jgi:hypothetical protein